MSRRDYPAKCKPRGSEIDHGKGYKLLHRPGHVLADSRGKVLAHRLRLFERIGGMPTICHHCGRTIDWFARGQQRLVVDHLDGDRSNNATDNLVPSCYSCNSYRDRHPGVVQRNAADGGDLWSGLDITAEDLSAWMFRDDHTYDHLRE